MRKSKHRRDDHNTPTNTQREFMGVVPRARIHQPTMSRGVSGIYDEMLARLASRGGILKLKGDA